MRTALAAFLVLLLLAPTVSPGAQPAYPAAPRGNQSDDFHGTIVADPYRWLEDSDSPAAVSWIKTESELFSAYLAGLLVPATALYLLVPLCEPEVLGGKPAERLNPAFDIEGRKFLMLTPELAGVPRKALGERVGNLAAHRAEIIAALDIAFTGI